MSTKKTTAKRKVTAKNAENREQAAHSNPKRVEAERKRVGFTNEQQFIMPHWAQEKYPREEYHPHFFTETEISRAQQAGYKFAETDEGDRFFLPSKNSEKTTERQILMVQPMKCHLEDMAEKRRKNQLLMAKTKKEIDKLQDAVVYDAEG